MGTLRGSTDWYINRLLVEHYTHRPVGKMTWAYFNHIRAAIARLRVIDGDNKEAKQLLRFSNQAREHEARRFSI